MWFLGRERNAHGTSGSDRAIDQCAGIAPFAEGLQVRGIQTFSAKDRRDLSERRRFGLCENAELVFGAEATPLRALWDFGIGHG